MGKLFAALLILAALMAPPAHAWGPYAHQQIHLAAMELIRDTELGQWLERNRRTGKRLSMTPDIDWKVFGAGPSDPELRRLKQQAHGDETPTHFFDADIFSALPRGGRMRARELPQHPDYADAYPDLRNALIRNSPHLRDKDWSDPTPKMVASMGSGPWRAVQMYDLAVLALSRQDHEKAMIYLSALGHYIADMAVPLHTTVHFDGVTHEHGLHLAFEMKMIEAKAALVDSHKDTRTELWRDFSATHDDVLSWAARGEESPVSRETLVGEILTLIEHGYRYIAPLNKAYEETMNRRWFYHSEATTMKRLGEARMKLSNGWELSVMDGANERMGAASRLLSRVWLSVMSEARKLNPTLPAPLAKVAFDEGRVIRAFVPPRYIPVSELDHADELPPKRRGIVPACTQALARLFGAR